MNMKYLAILFGASLALAGCVIETTGGGGNGGSGGGGVGGGVGGGGRFAFVYGDGRFFLGASAIVFAAAAAGQREGVISDRAAFPARLDRTAGDHFREPALKGPAADASLEGSGQGLDADTTFRVS